MLHARFYTINSIYMENAQRSSRMWRATSNNETSMLAHGLILSWLATQAGIETERAWLNLLQAYLAIKLILPFECFYK